MNRTQKIIYRRFPMILLLAAVFLSPPSLSFAEKPKELRIVIIPVVKPEEVVKAHQPLAAYLEKRLGVKVKVTVPVKYEEVVEAIAKGTADLGYLGGLTYIQLKKRIPGVQPIIISTPREHHTVMITKAGSGIKSISDLKGKSFAFGSEKSTSGHLIPRGHMVAIKFDPISMCSKVVFTGGHDKAVMAVVNGEVDAGAAYKPVYEKMMSNGMIQKGKIQVFWQSPAFADFPWVVRDGMSPEFVNELKKAFIDIKDETVLNALKPMGMITGYTNTNDDAFSLINAYERLGFVQ